MSSTMGTCAASLLSCIIFIFRANKLFPRHGNKALKLCLPIQNTPKTSIPLTCYLVNITVCLSLSSYHHSQCWLFNETLKGINMCFPEDYWFQIAYLNFQMICSKFLTGKYGHHKCKASLKNTQYTDQCNSVWETNDLKWLEALNEDTPERTKTTRWTMTNLSWALGDGSYLDIVGMRLGGECHHLSKLKGHLYDKKILPSCILLHRPMYTSTDAGISCQKTLSIFVIALDPNPT